MPGARVAPAFAGRRREVQDAPGRDAQARERAQVVEVAHDRRAAVGAELRDVVGAAHEADEPRAAGEKSRRAHRDVAAADDEQADHARDAEAPDAPETAQPGRGTTIDMTFKVTIKPDGHAFACEADETVLEAAMKADLLLPYGCRNGACGTCKGKILSGAVDYGPHAPATLTDDEKRAGYALFCCAKPASDLAIEVREVRRAGDIPVKRMPCRVESIDKPAADVAIVRLKLPANERLQFLAGQYVDFLLKDGKRRSFSLANPPHDDALLEIHVRHVPGGLFTGQLFREFKGREILRIEGPLGSFYLREESDKPMIFVAGGTGFAPIKAMIEHALFHGVDRPIVLYWGARARKDLYLPEVPGRWQQEHGNVTFIPVMTDPLPDDAWPGRTGLVHRAVMDDFADLSGYQVYACGAPAMIDAARRDFAGERNLPPDEFFADSFTYAAAAEAPA
jgi:CDP-4-dehydro-6-deoxyglucose reductase